MQLADASINQEPLRLNEAFDMWQLGVCLHEAATGAPFWRERLRDDIILAQARPPHLPRLSSCLLPSGCNHPIPRLRPCRDSLVG